MAEKDGAPYLATAGEVKINALSQLDGTIEHLVALVLSNQTLQPVPRYERYRLLPIR